MRIAVVVHNLDGPSGIAKHLLRLSREYVALGHEVTLWTRTYHPQACYPALAEGLAIRTVYPYATGSRYRDTQNKRFPGYFRALCCYFFEQKQLCHAMAGNFDVINAHGNTVIWAAADYKRHHHTPLVWLCNDFWPLGSHRHTAISSFPQQVKQVLKTSLCRPFTTIDNASVRATDRIAVLSEHVQSQMRTHYGVEPVIIRAGVDADQFAQGDPDALRHRYGIAPGTFVVLTVGSLMPRRRLEDVIEAVWQLVDDGCDVRYLIVGRLSQDPDYTRSIRHLIETRGLENRVILAGEVSEQDLVDAFHACDAFVWSSDENQSWGMAAMEAMAAGKPVIVSRANGLAEVMLDHIQALLVEPRSPDSIAAALHKLIQVPDFARSMAHHGQRLVREQYSWRRNAEHMLALFEEAIKQPV